VLKALPKFGEIFNTESTEKSLLVQGNIQFGGKLVGIERAAGKKAVADFDCRHFPAAFIYLPRSFRNCLARRQSTHQLVPYIVISSMPDLILALREGIQGVLSVTLPPMR
jgi:hypothetical protein